MASQYVGLPASGGGSGAVDSVNGLTGIVVLTKSNVGLGNADNTSDVNKPVSSATQTALNAKQDSVAGSNSRLVYKNGSGVVQSLENMSLTNQLGLSQSITDNIEDTSSHSVNVNYLGINPTENSPDTTTILKSTTIELDPNDSGFSIGTNHTATILNNNDIRHEGESNTGNIVFGQNNFTLGNGTDPISVNGVSNYHGFGEIKSGVTINGPLQGYGYQPIVRTGATMDLTNSFANIFYDNTIYEGDSSYHTSFNASPTIENIPATRNLTAVSINPNVETVAATGSITGVNVGGTYNTFAADSSFSGININPTISSAAYAAGLNIDMSNTTVYPGVVASLIIQDLTIAMDFADANSNSVTVEYIGGGTAGSEVVTITGTQIVVEIESGVSTAQNIADALNALPAFFLNLNVTISGTASNTQVTQAATNLSGGINPGQKQAARFNGDVEILGALSFSGALSIGKLSAFANQTLVDGLGQPSTVHGLITAPTVGANVTVGGADLIGVNTAMLLNIGDNSVVTTNFLGVAALGLPAVVTMGAGSTVDQVSGATFALSLDAGGTGGTIATLDLCRSLAIPNGVTTVTRLSGYKMDLPFGDPGTTSFGVNITPVIHNYMAGSLLIGGTPVSADTVANSSVALEISSTAKALLNARMTTAERDALTAINGMQIYNVTTDKLQVYAGGSWVDLH